jgi:hypothetical protein
MSGPMHANVLAGKSRRVRSRHYVLEGDIRRLRSEEAPRTKEARWGARFLGRGVRGGMEMSGCYALGLMFWLKRKTFSGS